MSQHDNPNAYNALNLDELAQALTLQRLGEGCFEAPSFDFVGKRVFGGQVLAQALLAGFYTLAEPKPCHSLHAYFLRGGDIRYPVCYNVTNLRDGNTLSARQITASQFINSQETVIFTMLASFAHMDINPLSHAKSAPKYPAPHACQSEDEIFGQYVAMAPEPFKARLRHKRAAQILPINPRPLFHPPKMQAVQAVWVRVPKLDSLGAIDDKTAIFHQALLAFVSDFYLVTTALMAHGLTLFDQWDKSLQVASIDHSLHFHHSFDVRNWLLYEMKSDVSSYDKGLNLGQFWQEGVLVASSSQEGLMRYRE